MQACSSERQFTDTIIKLLPPHSCLHRKRRNLKKGEIQMTLRYLTPICLWRGLVPSRLFECNLTIKAGISLCVCLWLNYLDKLATCTTWQPAQSTSNRSKSNPLCHCLTRNTHTQGYTHRGTHTGVHTQTHFSMSGELAVTAGCVLGH